MRLLSSSRVARLIQLSDLHLSRRSAAQEPIFDRLVETLGKENEGATRVTLVVTGDVFDSAVDAAPLVDAFIELHERIVDALGGDVATIVLPGNHDRRRLGFIGPHREGPFLQLAEAARGRRIFVAGTRTPFLAQVVPADVHALPFHVIAYDSSFLRGGLVGAGGTIRLEDLLHAHSQLAADSKPLLLLVHHHLIPTPVTDISDVEHDHAPRFARWLLRNALPALVSNADREELTMTALGAGTALSALHTLGRPVLVLHGHKHMPTARLLRGMTDGCADVLIASAVTAGRRERVHATRDPEAARLWPSFNVVDLEPESVTIDAIAFSPKRNGRPPQRRVLVRASRAGSTWERGAMTFRVADPAPRVLSDRARYVLAPSEHSDERLSLECERTVELVEGAQLPRYVDFVQSVPRALVPKRRMRRVEIKPNGTVRYSVSDAVCRTIAEGARRSPKLRSGYRIRASGAPMSLRRSESDAATRLRGRARLREHDRFGHWS